MVDIPEVFSPSLVKGRSVIFGDNHSRLLVLGQPRFSLLLELFLSHFYQKLLFHSIIVFLNLSVGVKERLFIVEKLFI